MPDEKIGPLLGNAMVRMEKASAAGMAPLFSAHIAGSEVEDEQWPVVATVKNLRPEAGEAWADYRARVETHLAPMIERLERDRGLSPTPLLTANAVQLDLRRDQIEDLVEDADLELIELDPLVQVVQMDDAVEDIGLDTFRDLHPAQDGSGVSVAVLDSGVDTAHPELTVAESVETCGESVDFPGSHGTHVAGSIASQDTIFRGLAPGVRLLNVKVLRTNGTGRHTYITRGIDEALDLGAQVLSMSLGFNHLPRWSNGGHGWSCPDGRCPLCRAVDNAVTLDDVVAVVAAGNEHQRAEALRPGKWWPDWLDWLFGRPDTPFDTELGCPGQARRALTVGALTKRAFLPASFSSHGPSSYGAAKPDLAAPGVNITSTVPLPRNSAGQPDLNASRARRFGRKSGTSMATPIVAGAVALVIQRERQAGRSWTPADIRDELLLDGVVGLNDPVRAVGAGRLDLRRL